MKFKQLSLAILATLVMSCSNDDKVEGTTTVPASNPASLAFKGIKGQVKTQTEISYDSELKDGEYVKGKKIYENKITFDRRGLMTMSESVFYNTDGVDTSKRQFFYDDHNNIKTVVWEREGVKKEFRIENTYDSAGQRVKGSGSMYENGKKSGYEEMYKYAYSGDRITEYEEYNNEEGSLMLARRYTYKYDTKGNKIEEKEYSEKNELRSTTRYEYNDNGLCVKEVNKDEGEYSYESVYNYSYDKFDTHGNFGLKIAKNKEGVIYNYKEFTYTYY